MNHGELKELIDFLRVNGVAHYKGPLAHGYIELLLIEPPAKLPADEPTRMDPLATVPRGKDGLTAEEQESLFGAVIDAKKD